MRQVRYLPLLLVFEPSVDWSVPHEQGQLSSLSGGKNSSTGNSMFWNVSHGFCVEQLHSLSGIQKSYAGISICTSRSIWTIEKRPSETITALDGLDGIPGSLHALRIDCGKDVTQGIEQSQVSRTSTCKTTGSTAWTLATGFVYCGASGQSSSSLAILEVKIFTSPSEPYKMHFFSKLV